MINIAIDGPSGAGKSTVAKAVAKRLNIIYLDTGAMYRGMACLALESGVSVYDDEAIKPLLNKLDMRIEYGDVQQIIVNGKNVTPFIREHKISKAASDVSKLKSVRLKLVELQRQIAKLSDVVLDGRDIGSFVLPDAKYKFYITASPEVRAVRRHKELSEGGGTLTYDEILADIKDRDFNDSTRDFAPLKQTDDAILIDTSDMTIDEVTDKVLSYIKERI